MKKLISVLLTATMLLTLVSVAFAAEEVSPVIVVSGMGTDQYVINEDGSKTKIWPPQGDSIKNAVAEVLPGLLKGMLTNDYSDIGPRLESVKEIFLPLACDSDGKLINNVTADIYPLAIGNYPNDFSEKDVSSERAICRSVGDKIGYDNSYFFNYTWSRSPMDHADDLEKYIDNVLEQTGAKKVSLIACSMGGTITMSYLYKYGTAKIKNVTFASTAFLGTEIVGQLFAKDVKISIYDALRYFSEFTGYDFVQTIVVLAQKGIEEASVDILGSVDKFIADFVAGLKDILFSDVFLDTFVSMPGIWSLMPNSYYETAKATLVTDKTRYAFLENGENSVDSYMYNVQSKASKIIATARENGVNVYVTATYFCPGIPVMADPANYTDNLIDVKYAGGNATVAKYGETLSSCLNTVCSDETHNHLSPDSIIDASTCILPEQTWFIKNVGHMAYLYDTGLCGLLTLLSTSDEEISVYSDSAYPQFMEYNRTTKQLSGEFKSSQSDKESSYAQLIFELIKKLIRFLIDLVSTL